MAAHVDQRAGGGDLRLQRGAVRQDLYEVWGCSFFQNTRGSPRVLVGQVLESTRGLRLLPAVARLQLSQGARYFVAC